MHYRRLLVHNDVNKVIKKGRIEKKCVVPGCDKFCRNSMCYSHYYRFTKYGDANITLKYGKQEKKERKPCGNKYCEKTVAVAIYCQTCRDKLKKYGDPNKKLSKRKYFFNETFFDIETKESAYFLGLILTDGNISKYVMSLCLKDRKILEIFAKIIGYIGPIKTRIIKNKKYYRLDLCSKTLVESLLRLGISENKTFTVKLPQVQPQNFYHLIRGINDGDGCVGVYKKLIRVSIASSSDSLIESLGQVIDIQHSISIRKAKTDGKFYYCLNYSGIFGVEICRLMYLDSDIIRIERKFQKYQQYMLEKYGEIV